MDSLPRRKVKATLLPRVLEEDHSPCKERERRLVLKYKMALTAARTALEFYGSTANYEHAYQPDPEQHPICVMDDEGQEARDAMKEIDAALADYPEEGDAD